MLMPDIAEAKMKITYSLSETKIAEASGEYAGIQMFSEHSIMVALYLKDQKKFLLIPFEKIIDIELTDVAIHDDDDKEDINVN